MSLAAPVCFAWQSGIPPTSLWTRSSQGSLSRAVPNAKPQRPQHIVQCAVRHGAFQTLRISPGDGAVNAADWHESAYSEGRGQKALLAPQKGRLGEGTWALNRESPGRRITPAAKVGSAVPLGRVSGTCASKRNDSGRMGAPQSACMVGDMCSCYRPTTRTPCLSPEPLAWTAARSSDI